MRWREALERKRKREREQYLSVSKYSDLPRLLCVLRERKRERLLRSKDVQVSEGQMKREKKRKNEKRE